jgi:hypothetical protein
MKTEQAIERAGSAKALAELFDVTPSAVSQWGDDLPRGRYWQLRAIKPHWFDGPPDADTQAPATPCGMVPTTLDATKLDITAQ